jgi:hypothetical protein
LNAAQDGLVRAFEELKAVVQAEKHAVGRALSTVLVAQDLRDSVPVAEPGRAVPGHSALDAARGEFVPAFVEPQAAAQAEKRVVRRDLSVAPVAQDLCGHVAVAGLGHGVQERSALDAGPAEPGRGVLEHWASDVAQVEPGQVAAAPDVGYRVQWVAVCARVGVAPEYPHYAAAAADAVRSPGDLLSEPVDRSFQFA